MGAFDTTLGVLLIGIFFNTYLFGVVCYQFATYYNKCYNDYWLIKAAVGFLLVLDTFHSASVIYMAWVYCVTNFANPAALADALWPYTFTPIGTAMAAIVTHGFMIFRIYHLSGRQMWIPIVFIPPIITTFILGVTCGIKAWIIVDLSKLNVLTVLVTCWLSMQTAVDLIVAVAMAYVLMRSRTGYKRTDNVIYRLIRGAIQIGIFSSMFALGDLVSFAVAPQTNFYGMFAIPLGRIYTNTLMDTLNMRDTLKEMLSSEWMSTPCSVTGKSTVRFARGVTTTEQIELGDTDIMSRQGGITMKMPADRESDNLAMDFSPTKSIKD